MLPATFVLSDEAVPPGHPVSSERAESPAPSSRQPSRQPSRQSSGQSSQRRSPWRTMLVAAVVLVALLVGYYVVTLYQVWSTGRAEPSGPVDAIVVMGAAQYDGTPSPQLAARLDEVVRLWPEGLAPLVVTTGGKRPGDRFTEAEASAAYLTERGVPEAAIVLENDGSTTYESLEGVAELLEARGVRSVLIVTDPYHALRARMIAEEVGLDAHVAPTTTSVVHGWTSLRRHLQEAAGVALARPFGFERLRGLAG
jgi:uncharacterized SAM-binding protein YcdF (DUF218 family)